MAKRAVRKARSGRGLGRGSAGSRASRRRLAPGRLSRCACAERPPGASGATGSPRG